jgi:tetratricopeptide (TPR) repeat protein
VAEAYQRVGKLERAREYFRAVMEIDPGSPFAKAAQGWLGEQGEELSAVAKAEARQTIERLLSAEKYEKLDRWLEQNRQGTSAEERIAYTYYQGICRYCRILDTHTPPAQREALRGGFFDAMGEVVKKDGKGAYAPGALFWLGIYHYVLRTDAASARKGIEYLDRVADRYPESSWRNDALYYARRLSLRLEDAGGAEQRLKKIHAAENDRQVYNIFTETFLDVANVTPRSAS